jgi:hypothetical protein
LAWKLAIPAAIYLNHGNHEIDTMSNLYGFSNELNEKYRGG